MCKFEVKLEPNIWLLRAGYHDSPARVGRHKRLDAAEWDARALSKGYAAVTPLETDSPVYVYHEDGFEPLSVWVNGERVR